MEEIFKEYGGAIMAILGASAVLLLVGSTFLGSSSEVVAFISQWGIGGI